MRAERWERLEELFRGALERSPAERTRWLRRACGDDAELRRELEELLEADRGGEEVIERTLKAEIERATGALPRPGGRVGGWRLVEELGSGGSAVVYLAERSRVEEGESPRAEEGPSAFQRRAAVKILRADLSDPLARRRFEREGAILARLDHPGIARLLEAGTGPGGRPYLAMEHVEGEPLTEHGRALPLEERLQLFRQVCAAVAVAHRNLVVHGDLKPGNLLVTPCGRPKLLDFGIARLLEPERSGDLTVTAGRRLTPGYASPEQLRGEPLSTATDVFSLGVVLYELITGEHPFRRSGAGAPEVERAILEERPPPPSARLRASGGRPGGSGPGRGVDGDLDRVVATALAEEPERRYGSVEALAEDLRRWLEGRPVTARPPSMAYRARKFLQRHRAAAVAGVGLVLLLVAFAVSSAFQARRTERALRLAQEERAKAEQALSFLVGAFEVAGPEGARGETVTAREILEAGTERIERESAGQPRVQAPLLETLGRVWTHLGSYDRARELLQRSLELQAAAGETAPGAPADPRTAGRASTLLALGDVLQRQGDYPAAEAAYREALQLHQAIHGERHPAVADSLNRLGDVLHDRGDLAAAEPVYARALEVRRQLLGPEHPDTAESLNNLALLHHERRELERAEALYSRALEVRRRALGPDHPDIATSLGNLAALLHSAGRLDEAEALFREAVEMQGRLYGEDTPEITASLQNLALLRKDRGDLEEAEELLQRVLDLELEHLGEEHPNRATNLYHLGLVRREQGRVEEALELFRRAEDLYGRTLPPEHPWRSYPLLSLGELLLEEGRAEAARPALEESTRLRRDAFGRDNPVTAQAESALGACRLALGRRDGETEELLRGSLAVLEESFGAQDRRSRRARERFRAMLPDPAAVTAEPPGTG